MDFPQITSTDITALTNAQDLLTTLDMPRGGLGRLTTLSMRLVGMTGKIRWFPMKRATLLFAADHGVMTKQKPSVNTAQRVQLILDQKSVVNSMSRQMNSRLIVVDAGVDFKFKPRPQSLTPAMATETTIPTFVQRKIAMGSRDLSSETAMTADQAQKALLLGMTVAKAEQKRGLDLLFLGCVSSGNITSATAIVTAIVGKKINRSDEITTLIQQALDLHDPANEDTLMKLGGFEIGAMAGAILYAASQRIPIVLDGLASVAGALIANKIDSNTQNYLIAGHRSDEAGHQIALGYLGLDPLLDLGISMGEGTGALLAYPLIESAMRTLNEIGKRDVE